MVLEGKSFSWVASRFMISHACLRKKKRGILLFSFEKKQLHLPDKRSIEYMST